MTEKMINAIVGAYDRAREKHPYFCDWLKPNATSGADMKRVADGLNMARARVAAAIAVSNVGWDDLLDCETWGIIEALANDNISLAVRKCYAAIAVLLRTVDALEGRQPLGNPAKKGGAK